MCDAPFRHEEACDHAKFAVSYAQTALLKTERGSAPVSSQKKVKLIQQACVAYHNYGVELEHCGRGGEAISWFKKAVNTVLQARRRPSLGPEADPLLSGQLPMYKQAYKAAARAYAHASQPIVTAQFKSGASSMRRRARKAHPSLASHKNAPGGLIPSELLSHDSSIELPAHRDTNSTTNSTLPLMDPDDLSISITALSASIPQLHHAHSSEIAAHLPHVLGSPTETKHNNVSTQAKLSKLSQSTLNGSVNILPVPLRSSHVSS